MLLPAFYWYGSSPRKVRSGGAKNYTVVEPTSGGGPATVRVLLRTQVFQAVGLESVFDKVYIDKSYVQSETELGELTVIRRPLTFNEPHHYEGTGNRTNFNVLGPAGETCYAFSRDLPSGVIWSTRDIVEYLVAFFRPLSWDDENLLPVAVVDEGAVLPTGTNRLFA